MAELAPADRTNVTDKPSPPETQANGGLASQLSEISGPQDCGRHTGTAAKMPLNANYKELAPVLDSAVRKAQSENILLLRGQVQKHEIRTGAQDGRTNIQSGLSLQSRDAKIEADQAKLKEQQALLDKYAQYKDGDLYDMNAIMQDYRGKAISGFYKLTRAETALSVQKQVRELRGDHVMNWVDVPKGWPDNCPFRSCLWQSNIDGSNRKETLRYRIEGIGVEGKIVTDKQTQVRYFKGEFFSNDIYDRVGGHFVPARIKLQLPLITEFDNSRWRNHIEAEIKRARKAWKAGDLYDHDDREGMPPPDMRDKS